MNAFVQEQETIKARLQSSPYLADIPIQTEAKGTITEDVAQALAMSAVAENVNGKVGIAIVIRTPGFENNSPDSVGLALTLTPKVSIYENVVVNQGDTGIGKSALDVLQAVVWLLHGFNQQRGPRHSVTGADSEENADAGVIAYHVDVAVRGAINGLPT